MGVTPVCQEPSRPLWESCVCVGGSGGGGGGGVGSDKRVKDHDTESSSSPSGSSGIGVWVWGSRSPEGRLPALEKRCLHTAHHPHLGLMELGVCLAVRGEPLAEQVPAAPK